MSDYSLGRLIYELVLKDSDFSGKLSDVEKGVKKFEDTCKKTGESMTKFMTLPIIALGTASVKFAADAEVSSRKFASVYKDNFGAATDAVKVLVDQFKMSEDQARTFLGTTGNILKSFGMSGPAVLQTATDISKLGAALAAFSGKSLEETNQALNMMLMGNTRGMREFGLAIKQTAVEEELKRTGQDKLTGSLLDQAKAQAALKIVTAASADAIAGFQANSDGATFKSRQLLETAKEAAESLGNLLLPVFKQLIDMVSGGIKWFTALDDGTKKTIIIFAALAAAAGPVITSLGNITKAVNVFIKNPWVLVIMAVAAGLMALITALNSSKDVLGDLNKSTEDLVARDKELKDINDKLADSTKTLTEEQRKQLLVQRDILAQTAQNTLAAVVQDYNDADAAIGRYNEGLRVNAERQKASNFVFESGTKFKTKEYNVTALLQNIGETHAAYQARLAKAYGESANKVAELTAAKEKAIDTMAREMITGTITYSQLYGFDKTLAAQVSQRAQKMEEAAQKEGKSHKDLVKDLKDYNDAQVQAAANAKKIVDGEISDLEKLQRARADLAKVSLTGADEANRMRAIAILDRQIEEAKRAEAEKTEALKQKLADKMLEAQKTAHDAGMKQIDEEKAKREQLLSTVSSMYSAFSSAIMNLVDADTKNREQAVDEEAATQIAGLDKQLLGEEEYNKEVAAINKEAALKKWDMEVAEYRAKQVADTGAIAMSTAMGITQAWATSMSLGPIAGPIMAGILTGLLLGVAALQTAAVLVAPAPARPALAEGALGLATPGGIPATIAEGKYDEAVLPLSDAIFARIAEGIVAANQGTIIRNASQGQPTTFVINLEGQPIAAFTVSAINGGTYTISAKAVK